MPFMHGVNFLILRHKKWNLLFTMLCWGVDNPVLMVHANCLTGVNKFFESMSRMFHRLLRFATRKPWEIHTSRCFGLLVPAVVWPGLTFAAVVRLGTSWECPRQNVCWKDSSGCSSSLICGRIGCPQNGCGPFCLTYIRAKGAGN